MPETHIIGFPVDPEKSSASFAFRLAPRDGLSPAAPRRFRCWGRRRPCKRIQKKLLKRYGTNRAIYEALDRLGGMPVPVPVVSAGELRSWGFNIPDCVPDIATTQRHALLIRPTKTVASPSDPSLLVTDLEVTFLAPFTWYKAIYSVATADGGGVKEVEEVPPCPRT
jgi:hypothetical protein